MKRTFVINFYIGDEDDFITSGILELDQKVIDVVDDEWRAGLYNLRTPDEIAAHIGYNLLYDPHLHLTDLDGWADLSDDLARVISWPDLHQWRTSAKERK